MLGAGAGTRLRPLTNLRPKVLCPVGGVPLIDRNIARVSEVASSVAVNVHHGRDQLEAHLSGRVHLSFEEPEALGTGGAIGALREWLDGRAALVVNGDTWTDIDLAPLLDGWDGERVRVLVHGPPGTTLRSLPGVVGSLVPAGDVLRLPATPIGLSNGLWAPAEAAGRLEVLAREGPFIPVDRPSDYLAANLLTSGGASVIGAGAVVEGEITRCVLWPGAIVRRGESLVDAIRCEARTTVLVRTRARHI